MPDRRAADGPLPHRRSKQARVPWRRDHGRDDENGILDLRGTDAHSPAQLLELAERISEHGWDPELLDQIEQAGAQVSVEGGTAMLDLKHVDKMLFTITVWIPGRRAETIIDSEVGRAVAHGLRCCVTLPVIVDGQPLRP
jgi:riboflavin biosynthesis pyrimidine reductase